jgi:hypothetical protein
MKKILLASACILALSSAGAIAQQGQTAPGPASQSNVGPDTPKGAKKGMTTGEARDKRGDSKGSMPSGPKTNNMGRVIPDGS